MRLARCGPGPAGARQSPHHRQLFAETFGELVGARSRGGIGQQAAIQQIKVKALYTVRVVRLVLLALMAKP